MMDHTLITNQKLVIRNNMVKNQQLVIRNNIVQNIFMKYQLGTLFIKRCSSNVVRQTMTGWASHTRNMI